MVKKETLMEAMTKIWKVRPKELKSSFLTNHWNRIKRMPWMTSWPKDSVTVSETDQVLTTQKIHCYLWSWHRWPSKWEQDSLGRELPKSEVWAFGFPPGQVWPMNVINLSIWLPSQNQAWPLKDGRRAGWGGRQGQREDNGWESFLGSTHHLCIGEPEEISLVKRENYKLNGHTLSTLVPFLKQIPQ